MIEAMRYEREQGREPQDVSEKYLGYDILSAGAGEIAISETGPIELTPHEWQMAQRLGDSCWLYVVEYALTTPKLTIIQNPARNLCFEEEWGITKVVTTNWKEESA